MHWSRERREARERYHFRINYLAVVRREYMAMASTDKWSKQSLINEFHDWLMLCESSRLNLWPYLP
jgi:hypothetical protein